MNNYDLNEQERKAYWDSINEHVQHPVGTESFRALPDKSKTKVYYAWAEAISGDRE